MQLVGNAEKYKIKQTLTPYKNSTFYSQSVYSIIG